MWRSTQNTQKKTRSYAPETGIWRVVRTLMARLGLNSVSKTMSQSAALSTTGRGAGCWPRRSSHAREPMESGDWSPSRSGDGCASWSWEVKEGDESEGSAVRCTANSRGSFTRRRSFLMLPGRSESGACLARSALLELVVVVDRYKSMGAPCVSVNQTHGHRRARRRRTSNRG